MAAMFSLGLAQAKRLWVCLLLLELVLVLAYLADYAAGHPVWTMQRLLDLDSDFSIGAWFSSVQLALVGLLFLLKSRRRDPALDPAPWFLLLAAAGFLFLSADEALFIHESITEGLKKVDWMPRFRGDHGIWIFFYIGAGLGLLALTTRHLRRLWRHRRPAMVMLMAGTGAFLGGAVGLEIIAYQTLADAPRWVYLAEVAAEEYLEMLGASTLLYGAILLIMPARARAVVVEPETAPLRKAA